MMANGQQVAEENHAAFLAWAAGKSDSDFREYVHRGKLKRSEIATECGFGKSALTQNPAIRSALDNLESELRAVGVLPPLAVSLPGAQRAEPAQRDPTAKQRQRDGQRLNSLEQENASLRAELQAAKQMLERNTLLNEFLEETGRMPR
ncbi:VPA1267 family protein [Pseudomonas sp. 21LCFQ010]|uniref:VPA1267 family protein n=1 Tax=Pseudomonas sp. 21LCFQ010 TaxID=2957506 RepID=UPI002097BA6C|nr:VPA1267 family protein [Pseudomonas sp. 21LCFQ010]MCO8165224.1 VPA1267 family protein [Pseudomonas sp. 21LCFQ010]